ncbi:hypothetical protein WN51_06286 [Melipona quadrifasciata]|uniref:Uncharacterized protein n=1 Tax=Melipona quadrifasciata TaxID=166423 RepID=A0A0N0BCF9_9HYME|nr:hypothetical protein WN51_06286 [Melipona quadrifasciata]
MCSKWKSIVFLLRILNIYMRAKVLKNFIYSQVISKTKVSPLKHAVSFFIFITENDFSGDNPENWASSGATLMQRKLAIG